VKTQSIESAVSIPKTTLVMPWAMFGWLE